MFRHSYEATEDIVRGAVGELGPDEPALVYGYATDETPELMPLPTLRMPVMFPNPSVFAPPLN